MPRKETDSAFGPHYMGIEPQDELTRRWLAAYCLKYDKDYHEFVGSCRASEKYIQGWLSRFCPELKP
jgi:hypothetical protein